MTETSKEKLIGGVITVMVVGMIGLYNFIGTTNTDLTLEKERSKKEDGDAVEVKKRMHELHNGLHDAKDDQHRLELRIQKLETTTKKGVI